jgi:phospholipid transport system substrate-binding protein
MSIEQTRKREHRTLGWPCWSMVNQFALTCSIVALLLMAIPRLAAAATESPREVVQQTTDQVLKVLANSSLTPDEKRHEIENIVYAHFDFRTLSRLVLARNWKRLTPQQQEEFVEEFKKHLSMTYGKNVETYNNERAVVTGDREEPGGDWTVKTRIIRPTASDFDVDYRLRKEDGQWHVIDVTIESVSLLANYRSQFQEIFTNQGPAKLIDLLREKNAKGEPLKS